MYKKICITNRAIVNGNFLEQIRKVAASDVDIIILREKDLPEKAYEDLAIKVKAICEEEHKKCIVHNFDQVAARMHCANLHVSMEKFRNMTDSARKTFANLGVSIHSVEEAIEAVNGGAAYLIAGSIFPTTCKPGLEPFGLELIKNVTEAVNVPVYAIGGITSQNMDSCLEAGAKGICRMSGYMKM